MDGAKTTDATAATKKADEDAKCKKAADDKRPEDIQNHLTKDLFMLTQSGLKLMKHRPNFCKIRKLIHKKTPLLPNKEGSP